MIYFYVKERENAAITGDGALVSDAIHIFDTFVKKHVNFVNHAQHHSQHYLQLKHQVHMVRRYCDT